MSYLNVPTIFYRSDKIAVFPNDGVDKFNIQETSKIYLGVVSTSNNQTIHPFYTSLLINGWIVHNYILYFEASSNVMFL